MENNFTPWPSGLVTCFARQQETTGSFLITHRMPWWVQFSYYQLCLCPEGTVVIPSTLLPNALSLQDKTKMSLLGLSLPQHLCQSIIVPEKLLWWLFHKISHPSDFSTQDQTNKIQQSMLNTTSLISKICADVSFNSKQDYNTHVFNRTMLWPSFSNSWGEGWLLFSTERLCPCPYHVQISISVHQWQSIDMQICGLCLGLSGPFENDKHLTYQSF